MTRATTAHVLFTFILGAIVTALCCYAFYTFRTSTQKEKSIGEAMKAIKAATEIVSMIAEKNLPSLKSKLDEIEQKNRQLEKRLSSTMVSSTVGESSSSSQTSQSSGSATMTNTVAIDEAAILAARRAARSS